MTTIENPPAFPVRRDKPMPGGGSYRDDAPGMDLRDWFASQADQPGVSEIVSMAGGETDGFWVKFSKDGAKVNFNEWWNSLPLVDRCQLSARVRYALADAMIAARVAKP